MSLSKQRSRYAPQKIDRLNYQAIFEDALTKPVLVIDPTPILVWPIPGYVPPPQSSSKNKIGFSRSSEVAKLRNQRLWAVKTDIAKAAEDPPMEVRVVSGTTWKNDRLYDYGNHVQSCKALLDSLQPDVIKNDSLSHCVDFYSQRSAKADNVEPGTLVVVYKVQRMEGAVPLFSYGTTQPSS